MSLGSPFFILNNSGGGMAINIVTRGDIGKGLEINETEQLINVKTDNTSISINDDGALEVIPSENRYKKYTAQITEETQTIVINHDVENVLYTIVRVTGTNGVVYHPHNKTESKLFRVEESYIDKTVTIYKHYFADELDLATIEVFVYPV